MGLQRLPREKETATYIAMIPCTLVENRSDMRCIKIVLLQDPLGNQACTGDTALKERHAIAPAACEPYATAATVG